jgi:nucleoside 2-deoxyribosyltransferase
MPKPAGSPVYLSGPMFSNAEVGEQQKIARALEKAGFETYSPQRDGIELARVMGNINAPPLPPDVMKEVMPFVRKLVFAVDVYQLLERCKAVVFNLDGRVPDDGSVMEAALGWTAGLPVVIYKTTPITMLGGQDNPMVSGLGMRWNTVSRLAALPQAVADAVAADNALGGPPYTPGAHAKSVIDLGRKVWGRIDEIHHIARLAPGPMEVAAKTLMNDLGPLVDAAS